MRGYGKDTISTSIAYQRWVVFIKYIMMSMTFCIL